MVFIYYFLFAFEIPDQSETSFLPLLLCWLRISYRKWLQRFEKLCQRWRQKKERFVPRDLVIAKINLTDIAPLCGEANIVSPSA